MPLPTQNCRIVEDPPLHRMLQGRQKGEDFPVEATFQVQFPHIDRGIVSCVLNLQHVVTGESFAGKVLLPINDGLRNYTNRRARHRTLQQCQLRSIRFAPEGVCIGLRPIIRLRGNLLSCGPIADPAHMDSRFEYVWLMHVLKMGDSVDQKLGRNVAILKPLADAVHLVHGRADILDADTAWQYARPEKLQQKFLTNLTFFEKALLRIEHETDPGDWKVLWPASCSRQLAKLSEMIFRDDGWQRIFLQRIEHGSIRKGHGDMKAKNIWFSDYYRSGPVRNFTDCLTFFDPVDFDDQFNTIDILSEAAMLLVDLQHILSPVDFAHFVYFYVNSTPAWSMQDELVLSYYTIEKALVSTYITGLFDHNPTNARQYLWLLRVHLNRFVKQSTFSHL